VDIYTIGFTKRTAEEFFETLRHAGVTRLIDVRLNNVSQLAGFSKRGDLGYFLSRICAAEYVHEPLLAPTRSLFDLYKKQKAPWSDYEAGFRRLMSERRVERRIPRTLLEGVPVLLCSERTADHCHRRLVCEYLDEHWGDVHAAHL
jgi:uncharacterized protein (DUF488 family)